LSAFAKSSADSAAKFLDGCWNKVQTARGGCGGSISSASSYGLLSQLRFRFGDLRARSLLFRFTNKASHSGLLSGLKNEMVQKKNRARKPRRKVLPAAHPKVRHKPRSKNPPSSAGKFREYAEFVENIDEMILLIDRDYRVVMGNRAYLKHWGANAKQIVGRLVPEILNEEVFENFVKPKLDECLRGRVVKYEMKYRYPHLGERDLFISYYPIKGPSGVERVACAFEDITERKRAESDLRQLSARLLHVQDHERRRLARELHDGIGTYLSGLSLALGKIRNFLDENDPAHRAVIEECKELIQTACGEIRSISYLLHPPALEELGLESTLDWLVKGFSNRSGIAITLKMDEGLGRFKPEVELTLFRVTQEALNNVYRHSGSSTAEVRLFRKCEHIVVEISDRGQGMPAGYVGASPNLTVGISGMQERVRDVGGTFSIESAPGGGCVVRATLPVDA
jgi:two-component system, NarL family, sensor kinase